MGRLIVNVNVTLDGVMQAPGRPDEDPRGGFQHGGWAIPYFDPAVAGKIVAQATAGGPGLMLFGRRTYQDFYSVWPEQSDSPFSAILNNAQKYVASRTLKEPLPWRHSVLLAGDVPAAVGKLKQRSDKDIVILGSGVLVRSLMDHDLIDEYQLSIHPLVLGSGYRLFPEGSPLARLKLVDSSVSSTGVIIATYQPVRSEA